LSCQYSLFAENVQLIGMRAEKRDILYKYTAIHSIEALSEICLNCNSMQDKLCI